MVDRKNQYLKPESLMQNANVQRTRSFLGAKLNFNYTGKEGKTNSSQNERPDHTSRIYEYGSLRLPGPPPTFDYSTRYNSTTSPALQPGISRRSTISHYDALPVTAKDSLKSFEPRNINTHITGETSNLYGKASSVHISHHTKDVPLATSATPFFSSSQHTTPRFSEEVKAPPAPLQTNLYSKHLPSSQYLHYSSYDTTNNCISTGSASQEKDPLQLPVKKHSPRYGNSTASNRRQTTSYFSLDPQQSDLQPFSDIKTEKERKVSFQELPIPSSKPLSLNSQMRNFPIGTTQNVRPLTFGYTARQNQETEKAKELIRAEMKKEEEQWARMEARKKLEEEQRKAEADKYIEMQKKIEEARRIEAERIALEASIRQEEARRAQHPPDEDEDVEKFIKNLEQRIKDSRDSKNLKGALVGRQLNQNLAKNAENLTNALTRDAAHDFEIPNGTLDQVSAQSVTHGSEEFQFLQRIKNLKTDQNANRKKFAEHYVDYDDDDSEINSSNSLSSFLSTVTEEDELSLDNHTFTKDPGVTALQPCVISYIHNLVDGILSSLDKTDFANTPDTHKKQLMYCDDLYSNAYNYQAKMSETAKHFFTPRSSLVEDATNIFYNDSL